MSERNTLSAVLVAGYLGNDLGGNITCRGKAVGLLYHGAADHGAVLEHVLQVDQITVVHVLRIIIGIMEMNDSFFIGLHNILREQHPLGQIPADLSCHIISLDTVNRRILIGILLFYILIVAFDQREDPVVRGICLSHQ